MDIFLTCGYCSILFQPKRAKKPKFFCSHACYNASRFRPQIACICQQCGKGFSVKACLVDRGQGLYCSSSCAGDAKRQPFEERFWSKVQQCTHESACLYCCWGWSGGHDKDGYGTISRTSNKPARAHRVAWEVWHGHGMPDQFQAAHYCNYPPCVNPMHIYPATPRQNKLDSVRIGTHAHGTKNGMSKIVESDIPDIFAMTMAGLSTKRIASIYEVSKPTIAKILHRQTWRHVPIPE